MEVSPWDPEGVEVVLDPQGRLSEESATSRELDLKALYKLLVAARALDLRLGRLGLPMWASSAGEEAPVVVAGMLAGDGDWIYPGHRDVAVAGPDCCPANWRIPPWASRHPAAVSACTWPWPQDRPTARPWRDNIA